MPRTITIHPMSLAVGLLLAAVVFITMSQASSLFAPRIEYGPHPLTYLQIRQGTPFVVPTGSVFVPTAVGSDQGWVTGGSTASMHVNGIPVCWFLGGGADQTMCAVPSGLSYPAGTTIEAFATAYTGQVWGYLARDGSAAGVSPFAIRIRIDVPARDYVGLVTGSPLTVPPGKLFVLTAANTGGGQVAVDGVVVYQGGNSHTGLTINQVPEGLTVHAGSTITLPGGSVGTNAWGYMITL